MPYDPIEILSKTRLFSDLASKEISFLASQIATEEFSPGDIIVNEGEIGNRLYIIVKGSVRVFTTDKQGNEIALSRLDAGDFFGEQALLTTKPLRRNASVRALTTVTTATLSHETFLQQLKTNTELLKLLQDLGEAQLASKLAKLLQERRVEEIGLLDLFSESKVVEERQVLFWQNDISNKAYYLLSGSVDIRFYDDTGKFELRSQVNPGQFFGEQGIIENNPRVGTAVALTDSDVFEVSAETLQNAYQRNPQLHTLMNSIIQVYQVPSLGIITQYQGSFLGQPAIHTTIHKTSGDIIVASRVLNVNIFAIAYADVDKIESIRFEDAPDHVREIKLFQNRLVSIVSIGRWDDLDDACHRIFEKFEMQADDLKFYQETGKFIEDKSKPSIFICECMQVTSQQIFELLSKGVISLDRISKKTGAGIVCGGCRPQIKSIIGSQDWTYVKIIGIREHNDFVRSYQLQPINHDISVYLAGQHITIEAIIDNRWVTRNYTLTSVDDEKNYYEITVRLEPLGVFSPWIFNFGKIGTIMRVADPEGSFVFYPEKMKPAVCLVGGIGITPAIAFARKLTINHLQRPLYIDYSIENFESLTFREEFAEWLQLYKNVTTYVRVTSEQGHMKPDELKKIIDQFPEADFFICGSTEYEKAIRDMLLKENICSSKIHLEQFTHAGGPSDLIF